MRWWFVAGLAGCAGGGAAGDWNATSASSGAGDSVASGILEIDRDGEVLLELTLAGDGPTGRLSGEGQGSVSGARATFTLAADWNDAASTIQVTVGATCDAADGALACDLDVDGAAWTVDFVREPGLDVTD